MTWEMDYRVYLVTDDLYLQTENWYEVVENCLQAGVTALQYRAKEKSSRQMWLEAGKLQGLCRKYQVPLIINDRLDIALAVSADGLHLGQSDLPLVVGRRLFPGKIIGVSATTYEEGREAILQGADYVGVGPIYPTATKKDANPPCGLLVLKRLSQEFPQATLVAIGGIDRDRVPEVIGAQADGLAIIAAILGAPDPVAAVREFHKGWEKQ